MGTSATGFSATLKRGRAYLAEIWLTFIGLAFFTAAGYTLGLTAGLLSTSAAIFAFEFQLARLGQVIDRA